MKKVPSTLTLYLITSLVLQPAILCAKSEVTTAAEVQSTQRLVILEVNDGQMKAEVVEKVADTLRDALGRTARFDIASKGATYSVLQSSPQLLQAPQDEGLLQGYVAQSKEHYKNFDFNEAIADLQKAIETYRGSKTSLTENFQLIDAYLGIANIYTGMDQPKKAMEYFQEAIRLDPNLEITEIKYAPRVVKAFQGVKAETLAKLKRGKLNIEVLPKQSDIYINGIYKGQGPVTFNDLSQGEHFIVVKQEGYVAKAVKINLSEAGGSEKIILDKEAARQSLPHSLSISSLGEVNQQVRMATAVGKNMGVQKVVLVSVESIGWHHKITARMIDVHYMASYKPKSVEVVDLAQDTSSATSVISASLLEMADQDLAKNPKKYADSDVIVIGEKKKKSRKKIILLSLIGGVLAAGGAASAFLIGGGKGDAGSSSSAISVGGAGTPAP